MKIQSINMYQSKNLVQKQVSFGDADEWPDDPWHAEINEVHDEFSREYNELEKKKMKGEISDRRFFKEKDALFKWFSEQKVAIMEKYHNMAINKYLYPEEVVVKKPSFLKRLLRLK